jgi:hypothetical protein
MAIVDERDNSDVKDIPLNLVVLAAYSFTFLDETRAQYTRAFEHAHSSDPLLQEHPSGEQKDTTNPLSPLDRAETPHPLVTLSNESFCIPSLSIVFPRPGSLHMCSWRTRDVPVTDTIYLNPSLLRRYEKDVEKRRLTLLSIIYCIVIHEVGNLLNYKSINGGERDHAFDNLCVDVGEEAEYQIFGGRILTKRNFGRFRIQRRDGDIFDLDPNYFYRNFMTSRSKTIEFDKLSKVETCETIPNGWMGLGKANGTYN